MKLKIIYRFVIASAALAALAGAGCSKVENTGYPAEAPTETSNEADLPIGLETSEGNTSDGATSGSQGNESDEDATEAVREITMIARKWEFTPNTLTLKKGQKVRLSISSVDVDHSFSLPAFNVDERLIAGQSTVIEFTPTSAGTFPFTCTVYCGAGHGDMRGEAVVTE